MTTGSTSSLQHSAMLTQVSVLFYLLSVSGAMRVDIVGGKEVKPHSRPYMVSLQYNGQHTCGGFLIRQDLVLTAAHCLNNSRSVELEAVLGAHDIKKRESSQQRIPVKYYFRDSNYEKYTNAGNFENLTLDIMLLKLKSSAKLNKFVKVLALPKKKNKTPADVKCTIAGWGKRTADGGTSDVLYEASLKLLPQVQCKKIWQQYYFSSCMMCTATTDNNAICQGDSGGPLMCKSKPWGLAIYTAPEKCDNPKFPGVYLNISTFLNWIKGVMGK